MASLTRLPEHLPIKTFSSVANICIQQPIYKSFEKMIKLEANLSCEILLDFPKDITEQITKSGRLPMFSYVTITKDKLFKLSNYLCDLTSTGAVLVLENLSDQPRDINIKYFIMF